MLWADICDVDCMVNAEYSAQHATIRGARVRHTACMYHTVVPLRKDDVDLIRLKGKKAVGGEKMCNLTGKTSSFLSKSLSFPSLRASLCLLRRDTSKFSECSMAATNIFAMYPNLASCERVLSLKFLRHYTKNSGIYAWLADNLQASLMMRYSKRAILARDSIC